MLEQSEVPGILPEKGNDSRGLLAKYLQMKNDYPREALYAMMNLVDSHDAARPLYYLTNTGMTRQRMH